MREIICSGLGLRITNRIKGKEGMLPDALFVSLGACRGEP